MNITSSQEPLTKTEEAAPEQSILEIADSSRRIVVFLTVAFLLGIAAVLQYPVFGLVAGTLRVCDIDWAAKWLRRAPDFLITFIYWAAIGYASGLVILKMLDRRGHVKAERNTCGMIAASIPPVSGFLIVLAYCLTLAVLTSHLSISEMYLPFLSITAFLVLSILFPIGLALTIASVVGKEKSCFLLFLNLCFYILLFPLLVWIDDRIRSGISLSGFP